MRFVLDEDVDARLRKDIHSVGHDCWTIPESGLSGEEDANVAVYAHQHAAVLVTNDKEFSQRARRRIHGQHVYLNCRDVHAREVFNLHMDSMLVMLDRYPDLYISVSRERMELVFPNQSTD